MSATFNPGDKVRCTNLKCSLIIRDKVGTIMGPPFQYIGETVYPVDFGNVEAHTGYWSANISTPGFDKFKHWVLKPEVLELVSSDPVTTQPVYKDEPMV